MQSTSRNRILAFATVVLVLSCQCLLTRDIREPWAEDATEILVAALSDSWNPLQPMIDMFLLTGRLMGLVAVAISLEWAPVLLSIFSIVLYSFITSYFCRPGFSWLVPNHKLRLLASIGFGVVSGTPEVVGNAVCAAYTLPVFAILLLLERPHAKGIIPKWVFILLSTPLVFITIPLTMIFYALRRERLYLWLLGLDATSLLVSLVLKQIAYNPVSPTRFHFDWQLLKAVEMLFAGLVASLVGAWGVLQAAIPALVLDSIGLALCFFIWNVLRRVNLEVALAAVGLLAIVPLYHGMHTLGRSYGYDILQLAIGLDWASRVSFFTVLFPLMVWIILISRVAPVAPKRVQRATIAILLLANCTLLSALGSAAPVRGSGHWEAFQRWLHEARRADFPRGSGAALPVLLPSGEVWATLACTREERSIACRVEQGSHLNKVYTLPVDSSARS